MALAAAAILGGWLAIRQLRVQASYARLLASDRIEQRWGDRISIADRRLHALAPMTEGNLVTPANIIDGNTAKAAQDAYGNAGTTAALRVEEVKRVVPYVLLTLSPRLVPLSLRAPNAESAYEKVLIERCRLVFPVIEVMRRLDDGDGRAFDAVTAVVEGYVNAVNDVVEMIERGDAEARWLLAKLHLAIIREVHVLEPFILWKAAHSSSGRWGMRVLRLGAAARAYHWANPLHAYVDVGFLDTRRGAAYEDTDYGLIIAAKPGALPPHQKRHGWPPTGVSRRVTMRRVSNAIGKTSQRQQGNLVERARALQDRKSGSENAISPTGLSGS